MGFNFVWRTIETYLLFYYVKILGLSPEFAATIFLVGVLVDWLADPLIGVAVDRMGARWPLRAWVLFAGPLLGLSLAAAFMAPTVGRENVGMAAMASHAVLRFAYSLGNIPYAALTARISDNPDEHVRLTGTRMQGAALGGVIAAIVYLFVPLSAAQDSVPFGVILLGLAAQPLFFVTYLGVRERRRPLPAQSGATLGRQFTEYAALLWRAREVRQLVIVILFAGLSATTLSKGLLFLFEQVGDLKWGYAVALLPPLTLFGTVPLWAWLSKRSGRTMTLRIAALLHLLAIALLALADPGRATMTLLIALALAGDAGMAVTFWALIPAVIHAVEGKYGTSGMDARIYALSTTARKLGQALSPQLIVLALYTGSGGVASAMLWAAAAAVLICLVAVPRVTRR